MIPSRDTRDLTLQCVASIRVPGQVPFEVIVVDDASEDETSAALEEAYPEVTVLRHESPVGYTAAVNTGLRRAAGDVLLLLNSDTTLEEGALTELRAAFAANPRLGIAGAQLFYPDGRPQWSGGSLPTLSWLLYKASDMHGQFDGLPMYRWLRPLDTTADRVVDWVPGAALAMRREVWDQIGPLDPRFHLYCSDLDVCSRAGAAGWAVAIVARCRVQHRMGATVQTVFGTSGPEHPALVWIDLIRWVGLRHGPLHARRLARTVAASTWLHLHSRRLLTAVVPSSRRQRWRVRNASLQSNLGALRQALQASPLL